MTIPLVSTTHNRLPWAELRSGSMKTASLTPMPAAITRSIMLPSACIASKRNIRAASPSSDLPAVGGVEVRLDENRVTHTDAGGYYSFPLVPFGVHRIEAKYQSGEPFFYTTDSPATADMNADRKSTRLNSSHIPLSRMPSSA